MDDDGEIELSNPNYTLDEIVKHTKTCTHTHTCKPSSGPDATHTHTCYHTHTDTQIFSPEENSSLKPKSSLGNRVAVRKYREKKKAHTAFLEEEVRKLRVINQQLVAKLQGPAALEAEISSLRGLLVDIRGNIDVKLGCVPFQNYCSANSGISFEEGKEIGLLPCSDKAVFSCQENSEPVIVDCHGGSDPLMEGLDGLGCGQNSGQ